MNEMKIVFEFTKTGKMIYISHLDITRLFLRVLRMAGLKPVYSQGFNPHPKMSMALPLSLGLNSLCELLEFETENEDSIAVAVENINEKLPEGIRVTSWWKKPDYISKSLASFVSAAVYEFMCDGIGNAPELLADFFARESIIVKKRNTEIEKEIRPEMLDYRIIKNMRGRMLAEATLSAMPGKTLNPVTFFEAFCSRSGIDTASHAPVITRTAILNASGKPLTEVL